MIFAKGDTTRQVILNGKAFLRIAHTNAADTPTEYKLGSTGEAVVPEKTVLHTFDATVEVTAKPANDGGDILIDNFDNQYIQVGGIN